MALLLAIEDHFGAEIESKGREKRGQPTVPNGRRKVAIRGQQGNSVHMIATAKRFSGNTDDAKKYAIPIVNIDNKMFINRIGNSGPAFTKFVDRNIVAARM